MYSNSCSFKNSTHGVKMSTMKYVNTTEVILTPQFLQ